MRIMPVLSTFPALRAHTPDALSESVASMLGGRFLGLPATERRVEATGNRYRLPRGELWFCSYGVPVTIRFPDSDYLRVQFRYSGNGRTRVCGTSVDLTAEQGCISRAETDIDFGENYQQVVWRVPPDLFAAKLAAMTGEPLTGTLSFDPVLDLASPAGRSLATILGCILNTIEVMPLHAAPAVLAELEQALAVSLLTAAGHSRQALFGGDVRGVAPWQVRRAEDFIEANWNRPISIEDLAAVTGTSARSLFRRFKEYRGCSPLDFAKRLRLRHAHRMLRSGGPETSVTEIAVACGFGDLGHFGKDYAKAFGELPSQTLRQARQPHLGDLRPVALHLERRLRDVTPAAA